MWMFLLEAVRLTGDSYLMKICKMLACLMGSLVCIAVMAYSELHSIPIGSSLGGIIAGILIPYLISAIIDLNDNTNWKSSQRKLKRAGVITNNTIIRISFAYLFRIKIDGEYFLVQNERSAKYQPVGGAYKFYSEEAQFLANNIPVENDDRIPVDKITNGDYRLLVKSKDLRKFVKRFNNTRFRESINDLSREFVEELFSGNQVDRESFGTLSYTYSGRHMTSIEYGKIFNHYELLLADIINVRLSDRQEELIKNLQKKNSIKYRFAKPNEIKSCGVGFGSQSLVDDIANHTSKILSKNTDKLMLRNKNNNVIDIKI